MALIITRGTIPRTPHTAHYSEKDVLALEEIHGCVGFSGPWSRKLHYRAYPTEYKYTPELASLVLTPTLPPKEALPLQPFLIHTADMPTGGDPLQARKTIVAGPNTLLSIVKPDQSMPEQEFFRNGEFHELYYVQEGEGTLSSEFGVLNFRKEHYIIVPKGTTYRIDLSSKDAYFLLIESQFPIEWPPHYMNYGGQATMSSPVVETEIDLPEFQDPIDERGDYPLYVRHHGGLLTKLVLDHHPFDVIGWEGALYPFIFDIKNHHGIAREIHTAPPVHQTFQSGNVPYNGFSVCSFVPQMEGWHPKEVVAPYAHYNVDSDETMFFCNTSYGARKSVLKDGTLTFHPGSTPHSPHGKSAQASLKNRGTMSQRLAVMLDTFFETLRITECGYQYAQKDYATTWVDYLNE